MERDVIHHRRFFRIAALILLGLALLLLAAWQLRARLAAEAAGAYFREHGIRASVEIGALGLSGASGRFALGPSAAPDVAADSIELRFDPLSLLPRVVEVRLLNPVVRARLEEGGKITLGSLQPWIDSLAKETSRSRFVSDDLAVALTGLRALLSTPGGIIEVVGDVKLVKNLPVSAALKLRPTSVTWRDVNASLRTASLTYDSGTGALAVRFSGDVRTAFLSARQLDATLEASRLHWENRDGRLHVTAPALRLQASAAALAAGQSFTAPRINATARNAALSLSKGDADGRIDFDITGQAGLAADFAKVLRASDPALANALAANLRQLDFALQAHVEKQQGRMAVRITAPLEVRGARGAALRVPLLVLEGAPGALRGRTQISLGGGGIPALKLSSGKLSWTNGELAADTSLSARFGYAMLRGAELVANGTLSWRDGALGFAPSSCVRFALIAFHPGANDLAREIRARLCPVTGAPMVTLRGSEWVFAGEARDAAAFLPLANAAVDGAVARLSFAGQGADFHGTATITAGRVSDRAASPRFNPLAGIGTAALQGGVWRGRFTMLDARKVPLGEATFVHAMASGSGTSHINAPRLAFVPDKLQPEELSPLLVAFKRAEGTVSFTGDIDWTRDAITSRGNLAIVSLNFMTPLGKAHAVKSNLAFTSLLPPATADNQDLTISRIDWTLPFSGIDLRFGFTSTAIKVSAISTSWAEGRAALGAFTVNLADPRRIAGAAELSAIALSSLVTASNLGSRVKLDGRISGHVPFVAGPDGFRIVNGRVASDGPGRLSIDRTLWTKGAPAANAVQDFAYQALENLSYESMTAELNSIPGGRLQILFRIKGKNDPPRPQTADIAVADIINGTALQKSVPLPSGTPIDLTLDTSLNFDELLKSYAEAWSKSLSPEGQPDTARGATP